MANVFSTNEVSQAGLALIAQASSANAIVFTKALSSATVPSDPEDNGDYTGIEGTIDASSATESTARVIALFRNTATSSSQLVKAIAIMAKLASQSDSEAVVFAYSFDADSQIYFPSSTAPSQRTRFAFAFDFSQTQSVSVTEAGYATLADMERLVSCHRAGNPNVGDAQTVLGEKTFKDVIIAPTTGDSFRIGSHTGRQDASTGSTIYEPTTNVTECNGTLSVIGELRVEDHVSAGNLSHPGFLSSKLIRGVRELYAMDTQTGYGTILLYGALCSANGTGTLGNQYVPWANVYTSEINADTANAHTVTISYPSSAVTASVSLTCDEHGLLVLDGCIVPEDANSYDLGKPQKAWDSLYLDGSLYISLGRGGQGFSINASPREGIAQFNNTYRDASSQKAIGKFDFLDADGEYGTLEAGEYVGMNSTISDVSHAYQPHATTVATIAVGALIMAIIPQGIMAHYAGSVVTAGTEFQVTSATNEVSEANLRYRWYVAMLRADTNTGEALWSVSTQADGATVLSSGMYKILCSVDIADSGQIVPVMAVLLQKTSDEYPN